MPFSNYLRNEILDHVLKVGAYTPPTNIYVGLSTTDPSSVITEPSGGGYARELCNDWNPSVNRQSANTNEVIFTTASANWGEIQYLFLSDALTGGNMLAYCELSDYKTVITGRTLTFSAGSIILSIISSGMSNYLANKILDHVLKTASFSVPTNLYVALSTEDIAVSATGSTITEPSGGGYTRMNNNNWNAAVTGIASNDGAFDFNGSGATEELGVAVGFAILDASTSGNLLFFGDLDSAIDIVIGTVPRFADGTLLVTIDQ